MLKTCFNPKQELPLIICPESKQQKKKESLIEWVTEHKNYIFQSLYNHGAILFRNFDLETAHDFEQIVFSLVPSVIDYKGGDSPRNRVSSNLYTSTSYPAHYDISLHNEKSFSNSFPSLIFFFCSNAPISGGETPILDGRKLYSLLDKDILHQFSTKKIKYIMNLHNGSGIGKSWQECFETTDSHEVESLLSHIGATFLWKEDGGLRIEETTNPVIEHPVTKEKVFFSQAEQWHPSNLDEETYKALSGILKEDDFYHSSCFGDNTPLDLRHLDEIRKLGKQNSVRFSWQNGDFLMVDNILTLHGRFAYTGDRKIFVALSDYSHKNDPKP